MNNDRFKKPVRTKTIEAEVGSKAEAYGKASLEICIGEAPLISVMYHKTKVICQDQPVECFCEGFKQGLAFALQGIADGKINMKILKVDKNGNT